MSDPRPTEEMVSKFRNEGPAHEPTPGAWAMLDQGAAKFADWMRGWGIPRLSDEQMEAVLGFTMWVRNSTCESLTEHARFHRERGDSSEECEFIAERTLMSVWDVALDASTHYIVENFGGGKFDPKA